MGRWHSNWWPRTKAASFHLGLSALIASFSGALVFFVWFPFPYREISGGRSLFELVVAVDMVLGPLLTWVVFDVRKPRKELVRDVATIGVLQLSALAYGLWSVYLARPVYLVYEVDRFVVVSAADVDPEDLPGALPAFQRLPAHGVRLIGVRDSRDGQERLRSFELALAGKDRSLRPDYWQELDEANLKELSQRAKPLRNLMVPLSTDKNAVKTWLETNGRKEGELLYLPVTGSNAIWTALLDAQSLKIVGYVPIDSL
jgi:hypothetical protein